MIHALMALFAVITVVSAFMYPRIKVNYDVASSKGVERS